MITIAICDDEMQFRKNVLQACHQYFKERKLEYLIKQYKSGEEFLMGEYPDILLLDINMYRISGFVIRDLLAKKHAKTRIVFLSENKNFIDMAFGRNVFGYLIKPIRYSIFCKKMDEIVEDIRESASFMCCKQGKEIKKVYINSVLFVESYGRYSKIYVHGDNEGLFSEKGICQWSRDLSEYQFVKCNATQVVNLQYVRIVQQEEITLINGKNIRLTPRFKKGFESEYERLRGNKKGQ